MIEEKTMDYDEAIKYIEKNLTKEEKEKLNTLKKTVLYIYGENFDTKNIKILEDFLTVFFKKTKK